MQNPLTNFVESFKKKEAEEPIQKPVETTRKTMSVGWNNQKQMTMNSLLSNNGGEQ